MTIRGHRRRPEDMMRIAQEISRVFIMVRCEGMSHRQAAQAMGCAKGTIQKRLRQWDDQVRDGTWIPQCRCRFCWGGRSAELEGKYPRRTRFRMGEGMLAESDPTTVSRTAQHWYDGSQDIVLSDPDAPEMRARYLALLGND